MIWLFISAFILKKKKRNELLICAQLSMPFVHHDQISCFSFFLVIEIIYSPESKVKNAKWYSTSHVMKSDQEHK